MLEQAQKLFALEAMETQVVFTLAVAIVFIMFFEGIWAVFRLPRRAILSLLRPWRLARTAKVLPAADAVHSASASGHTFVPAKTKTAPVRSRNRKRTARVNRRRFKPHRPVILKNTKIEPWLLAEPVLMETLADAEAPLRNPNAL